MSFEFVDRSPVRKRVYWHHVFPVSSEFEKDWWKGRLEYGLEDESEYFSVLSDGVEVARCHVKDFRDSSSLPGGEEVPAGWLEVGDFEVAVSQRGRGVGRAVIEAMRELYPGLRLAAFNDDAYSKGFWESLGWVRVASRHDEFFESDRVYYKEPPAA